MSKARILADLLSGDNLLSDGAITTAEITGITATADELNKLDGATVTTSELNKLAGTTATTSDFDKLSNVTASATELNYMTGATSSIQDQLDNITVTSGSLTKSFTNGETATITLAQSISPAPVVSVVKEVPQAGLSSKGSWDVNATASNYDLHDTAYDTTLTPSSTTVVGDVSTMSYQNSTLGVSGTFSWLRNIYITPDGSKAFILNEHRNSEATIREYSLSTPYSTSSATFLRSFNETQGESTTRGFDFNADGTKLYLVGYGQKTVYEYSLGSAYNLSSATYTTSFSVSSMSTPGDFTWGDNGNKFYIVDHGGTKNIWQFPVTTAYDLSTVGSPTQISNPNAAGRTGRALRWTDDGLKFYYTSDDASGAYHVYENTVSTAWDLTSSINQVSLFPTSPNIPNPFGLAVRGVNVYMCEISSMFTGWWAMSNVTVDTVTLGTGSFASTDVGKRIQGNGGDVILTSTAGAYDTTGGSDFTDTSTIASGSWTMHGLKSAGASSGLTISSLVNSTAGTVDVFNDNVSTMALYKLDGNGTESGGNYSSTVNSGAFTASGGPVLSGGYWSVDSTNANILTNWNQPETSAWMASFWMKSTATSFTVNNRLMDFREHTSGKGTTISWENDSQFHFLVRAGIYGYSKPLGGSSTILNGNWHHIVVGTTNGQEPVAYIDGVLITATSAMVRSDSQETIGVKIGAGFGGACVGTSFDQVRFFNRELSSSEVATLYAEGSGSATISVPTSQYHIAVTNASGQIDSASWLDINSMTADQSLGDGEAYYAVSTDDRTTWSVAKASDGVRPIVRDNAGTWQYNSAIAYDAATWSDAASNNEFYALQEALGATAFNRMDKTQLDAVADGSHFTLGDTLDLMIALKTDTASSSLPTSDGVTINYDAEALIQGAVLGTDYDFSFPVNNQVEITSNAAQNLKIRVV